MNVVAWILSGLLALAYLGAGLAKIATPREKLLANERMAWTADFQPSQVKLIGVAEVLGAIGLILPWATGIAPVLTPIAAVGLVLLQVGAGLTHLRRKETQALPINAVLALLALVVAIIRFAQL